MDSIKKQTFSNFEIIVIDDCSTDGSDGFIINLMKNNSRIKLIQHVYNQGILAGRIHGLFSSKGQYIMSLDPDDQYYNDSIKLAYNDAINSNADVLEFRMAVRWKISTNYNYCNCNKSFYDNEFILKELQYFDYFRTNFNIVKRIIKRSLYLQSMHILLPYIRNKRICNAEDLLSISLIYIYMKNMICSQSLVYLYYRNTKDSATTKGYVSKHQKKIQLEYAQVLATYFYNNRKNMSNCNPINLFKNKKYFNLYNNILDINRTQSKNCSIEIIGFTTLKFFQEGYCFITNS